jgi:hypothetical protein
MGQRGDIAGCAVPGPEQHLGALPPRKCLNRVAPAVPREIRGARRKLCCVRTVFLSFAGLKEVLRCRGKTKGRAARGDGGGIDDVLHRRGNHPGGRQHARDQVEQLILAGALALAATTARAQYLGTGSNPNSHPVQGHVTTSGIYVQPYVATNPNSTQRDNYSATGNVNPYTGAVGTRNPRY